MTVTSGAVLATTRSTDHLSLRRVAVWLMAPLALVWLPIVAVFQAFVVLPWWAGALVVQSVRARLAARRDR